MGVGWLTQINNDVVKVFHPDDKIADFIIGNKFSVRRVIVTHYTLVIHETERNAELQSVASDVALHTAAKEQVRTQNNTLLLTSITPRILNGWSTSLLQRRK